MLLHIDSDTAYLVMLKYCSCYVGHFYLCNWPRYRPHKPTPSLNGSILVTCKTIFIVFTSAAEAETTRTFNNVKDVVRMRLSLFGIEHEQPATPIKTKNSKTAGFINSVMKPNFSKTWYMKMNWLVPGKGDLEEDVTHPQQVGGSSTGFRLLC